MSQNAKLTLQSAPLVLQENFEIWREIWTDRCESVEKFQEESYSRHILLTVSDLIEEIEFNAGFIKNQYAKGFFRHYLSGYCMQSSKHQQPKTAKKFLVEEVKDELAFIMEALSAEGDPNLFHLSHLLPSLKRIDSGLTTAEVLDRAVDMLLERLDQNSTISKSDDEVVFLTDTIILLFWRNGRFAQSIKYFAGDILATLKGPNQKGKFLSSYPDFPEQGEMSNEDYGKLLQEFFSSLTIGDRFGQFKEVFRLQPREYKVIFRVTGFEPSTSGFDIGNVRVYDPGKEKYIKWPIMEGASLDLFGLERTDIPGHSIAVKMPGIDSTSMKLQARQTAERALAFLTTRKKREQPLSLSDNYSICNVEGKEVAWAGSHKRGEFYSDIWKEVTEQDRQRFGLWINQKNPPPTIQRWLSALDWHRQAVESHQSTQELLNAWFAVEHLFEEAYKISLRVPEFLRYQPSRKKGQGLWLHKKSIALIQLILGLIELKYEFSQYASNVASNFLPDFSMLFYRYKLPDHLLELFTDGARTAFYRDKFVEIADEIVADLKAHQVNGAAEEVEELRRLFFDSDYCKTEIKRDLWRIKDDVYNIYRIRNMLVHRATTQSKLVEYYAARAREYSFALLYELKWKFLRTKDDSQILSLEDYFQSLAIDSNIGLEAVQNGDMDKFRQWVFH